MANFLYRVLLRLDFLKFPRNFSTYLKFSCKVIFQVIRIGTPSVPKKKKDNLCIDGTLYRTMNLAINMSRFVVLGNVPSIFRLSFFLIEGVGIYHIKVTHSVPKYRLFSCIHSQKYLYFGTEAVQYYMDY